MIQVDVPITFAIGTLFADSARRRLRANPEFGNQVLLRANLYYLFFFSWVPISFLLNYFGWETSHIWWHGDSVADYPSFVPLFMLVLACGLNGGCLLGRWLIRRGNSGVNRVFYLGILFYSVVFVIAAGDHTARLGTYRELRAGTAPWFYTDRVFLFMFVFTMLLWPGALVVFLRKLSRAAERQSAGENHG